MQRNSLPAYRKIFCDGVQVERFFRQQVNDLPACRVCYGLKDISPDFHDMQVFACKNNVQANTCLIYFDIYVAGILMLSMKLIFMSDKEKKYDGKQTTDDNSPRPNPETLHTTDPQE